MEGLDLKATYNAAAHLPPGWSGDRTFQNHFGNTIRYGVAPAIGEKKGTAILTHGYGEHIELYFEAIGQMQKRGYEVWAMDWYGHGKSSRSSNNPDRPPQPDSFGRHVKDLHQFATEIVKRDKDKPMVLLTHSMGGAISTLYLQQHPDTFDGAFMTAPMQDIYHLNMPKPVRSLIAGAFNIASKLGFDDTIAPRIDSIREKLSDIRDAIKDEPFNLRRHWRTAARHMNKDAQVDSPTFGWIGSAFDMSKKILDKDALSRVKTPVTIISASEDDLVDNRAHERAAKALPHARHHTIDGARHGLWHENDGNYGKLLGYLDDFLKNPGGFMEKRTPATLAHTARPGNFLSPPMLQAA